jgi:uncharacterized protein (TIGR00297 family)
MPSALSVAIAVVASAAIALAAWRADSLSRSGATAALFVGTVALSTGAAWGAYLVGWFVLTSALARVGRVRKARHVRGIVDKGGARDAWQVLANGGVFALLVLGTWFVAGEGTVLVTSAAAASLAAAGADTWATEAGTWASGRAWSLRTGHWAPAGTSGAVTLPGSLAMVAGALCWSGASVAVGLVPATLWHAVCLGGVAGATADTVLGALGQQRRWCERCQAETEQHRHDCGQVTQHVGGVRWLDNDRVNLAATVIGAAMAALAAG